MSTVQNTLIQMQNSTNKIQFKNGRENLGSSKLDKNSFMTLLLAQLQHQDPMNPMEDAEFISQQAQFTQIEKMDEMIANMHTGNMIAQASSLVGKNVEFALEGGGTYTGPVNSVKFGNNSIGIMAGDKLFSMDQVVQIFSQE